LITLSDEKLSTGVSYTFYHPFSTQDFFVMKSHSYAEIKPLLTKKLENGHRLYPEIPLREIQSKSAELLTHFDKSYKRQINPHIYKVSLSERLSKLKTELILETKQKENKL